MKIGKGLKIAATGMLLGSVSLGAAAAGLTQVHGNVPSMVTKARMTGHHNPRAKLNISMALAYNDSAGLDSFLHSLTDRSSPNYHKFMSEAQFTAAYAPTQDQVNAVTTFLTSHGISVTSVSKGRTRIHGTATTATLESVFGVAINDYTLNGTAFYAASTDPSIPAGLHVVSVMGLDDAVMLQPHNIQNLHPAPAPKGLGAGPSGFGPQQIATAYDWPDITNTNNANGVTIAVATAFTYRPQDITKFWDTYGLPHHTLTNVSIDGTTRVLNGETTLDIERSSSMSPGSAIKVYEASTPAFVSFDDEFAAIADDSSIDVVTTSWGSAESEAGGGAAQSSIIAEHGSFQKLFALGVVVMAAAGDNGADDSTGTGDAADFPSSDPYVIAAGGTSLRLNNDNSINSEEAWSGAGGADSKLFAEPDYQVNFGGGGVFVANGACDGDHTGDFPDDTADPVGSPITVPGDGCTGSGAPSRQTSDMSMDANPGTGYSIYYNGRWEVFGGTSFVAPELAGFFANLVKQNGGHVGSGPALIFCAANADASSFHDITSGSNGPGGVFDAGAGWDHPTGWGTPDATALIANMLGNCLP